MGLGVPGIADLPELRRRDFVSISLFAFAHSYLWNSLHPFLLPVLLLGLVPEALKNTYLGGLTFVGLILAMFMQPLAGSLSDRSGLRWGRRRPFILAGTALMTPLLIVMPFAPTFLWLLAFYLLLQFYANFASGAYQGLIPDLVPPHQRGKASAAKNLAEILSIVCAPAIATLIAVQQLPLAFALLIGVLAAGALLTAVLVREGASVPLARPSIERGGIAVLAMLRETFRLNLRLYPDFSWLVASRFCFVVAMTAVQTFALYYIRDVISIENAVEATGSLMATIGIAILAVSYPTGLLADRIGRRPLIIVSGFFGAAGAFLMLLATSYLEVLLYGGLLGIGVGIFLTANWALATDLIPREEAARFLGLTNFATAGGAAAARLGGPLIDLFNTFGENLGYHVLMTLIGLGFLTGTLVILKVRERYKARLSEEPLPAA